MHSAAFLVLIAALLVVMFCLVMLFAPGRIERFSRERGRRFLIVILVAAAIGITAAIFIFI